MFSLVMHVVKDKAALKAGPENERISGKTVDFVRLFGTGRRSMRRRMVIPDPLLVLGLA